MRRLRFLRIGVCVAGMLMALPAWGDIKAFNAAVTVGDYRKAAAEAATTWPTLDKSRDDIALIAREFGFAAYLATDYAAAQTYAGFAAERSASDAQGPVSTVLLGLAEHKLKPSVATRDKLNSALNVRAALPGFDAISFLGADAVAAYDLESGEWQNAESSTDLAVKLTSTAGPMFALEHRRFALYAAIAEYMSTERPDVYDQFTAAVLGVLREIDNAASDEAARRFVPLYWEAITWRETLDSHLRSAGKRSGKPESAFAEVNLVQSDRRRTLLHQRDANDPCQRRVKLINIPEWPRSALYKGIVGSLVLQVDIDDRGRAINPEVLAAVPEKHFAKAGADAARSIRFERGEKWGSSCTMAKKEHIVTVKFTFPGR